VSETVKTLVVIVIDHSPEMRIGECFERYFRMKLPEIEVHTCATIADYKQVCEFIHTDPERKVFLVIYDWPMPHQVENWQEEEQQTIRELWNSSFTQSYRQNYMYCVRTEEDVEHAMRNFIQIANAANKPLPYIYYSMMGRELPKLLSDAKELWLTASGRFARA